MLADVEEPDLGQLVRQNGLRIAYMPQNPEVPEGATVASFALDGNSETDWQVQSNLTKLGIMEYDARLDQLSGGQRRRVAMAKVLTGDFDVLLLDEPTNHLDEEMISWLEDYLKNYKGTVVMVTHDRYFLDKVSNRILEISHGKMYSYEANYSRFLELKAEREEMELATERKRQSILRLSLIHISLFKKYRSWDTTMTVFSKLMRNSSSQAIASRSRWLVGSSRRRTSGLPKRALARRTLTFCPPSRSRIME